MNKMFAAALIAVSTLSLSAPARAIDPGTALVVSAGTSFLNNLVRVGHRPPACQQVDGYGRCVSYYVPQRRVTVVGTPVPVARQRQRSQVDAERLHQAALEQMGRPVDAASYHFNVGTAPAVATQRTCEIVGEIVVDGIPVTRRRCLHVD